MAERQPKTVVLIPARLESTRLPGKLLLSRTGKPLIEHTYNAALQSELASEVIVATDSSEIMECVNGFGGKVVQTRADHISGSSRVAEAAESLDAEIVVNVQGDEPEISGAAIDAAIRILAESPTAAVSNSWRTSRWSKSYLIAAARHCTSAATLSPALGFGTTNC